MQLAAARNIKVVHQAIGKGQGATADKLIRSMLHQPIWVVLENAHLAGSWMPALGSLVQVSGAGSGGGEGLVREGGRRVGGEVAAESGGGQLSAGEWHAGRLNTCPRCPTAPPHLNTCPITQQTLNTWPCPSIPIPDPQYLLSPRP